MMEWGLTTGIEHYRGTCLHTGTDSAPLSTLDTVLFNIFYRRTVKVHI